MAPRRDVETPARDWSDIIVKWVLAVLILEALMVVLPLLANLG